MADVGKIGSTINGDPSRQVIVIEERHTSRVGQVEIAIMLDRLYRYHGLRDLALEGAVVERGTPDAGWFHRLPDAAARTERALYLLKQGEISAAEFMAMVHPDFHLHPIEVEAEYSVELSPAAAQALSTYVQVLSKAPMTPEQQQRFKQLFQPLPTDGSTPPVEIWPPIIDGVVALAQELGVDVGDAAGAIQEARAFYIAAADRSRTMIDNTIPILQDAPKGLIVIDIGAAHTKQVVDLLRQQSVSVAVLSPLSLPQAQQHGDLYAAAYERKQSSQSVEPAGTLGALLNGRRKPPPLLDEDWFQGKEATMYATIQIGRASQEIAQAAAGGGSPPYGLDRAKLGLGGPDGPTGPIDIDLQQIQVIAQPGKPTVVIFPVQWRATGKQFWAGVWQVASQFKIRHGQQEVALAQALNIEDEQEQGDIVDAALLAILKELRAEPVIDDAAANKIETANSAEDPAQVMVGSDVKAFFAPSVDAALKAANSAS